MNTEPSNVTSNIPFKKKTNMFDNLIKLYRELSTDTVIGLFIVGTMFGLFVTIGGGVLISNQLHNRNLMQCVDKTHDLEGCKKAVR
jgi:hypothetical protein